MDETGLIYALLFVGVATLASQLYLHNVSTAKLQEVAPPIMNQLLCMRENGQIFLSKPASAEFCRVLLDKYDNIDEGLCGIYPQSKRGPCERLGRLVTERKMDCGLGLFGSKYKFAQGAPEIDALCLELEG